MELKIRKNSEDYIVDTIGEMDLYNSYKLKELVNKMIEKGVSGDQIGIITPYTAQKHEIMRRLNERGATCKHI